MSERIEKQVRFGGEAGQGVILAGVMLAEVAAEDGLEIAQSARYGAAMRGGDATADVVISSEAIDYPHVEAPDVLVVLSQPTYEQYAPRQRPGTTVVFDPFFVKARPLEGIRQLGIGATDAAIRKFGKGTGANVILLGALTALTDVITEKSLRVVIERSPKKKFVASNLEALEIGKQLAEVAQEVQA